MTPSPTNSPREAEIADKVVRDAFRFVADPNDNACSLISAGRLRRIVLTALSEIYHQQGAGRLGDDPESAGAGRP